MTIRNRLGLTSFSRNFDTQVEGNPAQDIRARPMRNASLPKIVTITVAGFGADDDQINVDITLPSGAVQTVTVTRASGVPADNAAAVTALAAAVNALAALNGVVDASGASDVLTLAFLHEGVDYPVATRVTACTATVATTQAAGGTIVPYGRFCAAGSSVDGQPALRPLTATDRDAQVRGITLRPMIGVNLESALSTDVDAVQVEEMCGVGYEGHVSMRNNGSVASAVGGTVYAVVATTGGDELGEARADASGSTQVATITVVADHQHYEVEFGIRGRDYEFSYDPTDGTSTTDLAIDGLEAAAAAYLTAAGLTGIVAASSASASASMTLTAAAGYEFDYVRVTSFNEDTPAVAGTVSIAATAVYAVPLDTGRFYWDEVVQPGAVGQIMCRA